MDDEVCGLVFHIMGFSLHDGPGIRTTVFLKGCPLSCWWCHNPESQSFEPSLMYFEDRCRRCGDCMAVCPERAVNYADGRIGLPGLCARLAGPAWRPAWPGRGSWPGGA